MSLPLPGSDLQKTSKTWSISIHSVTTTCQIVSWSQYCSKETFTDDLDVMSAADLRQARLLGGSG